MQLWYSSDMKHFPLPHIVDEESKKVYILCSSAITAKGIPAITKKFYPGYKTCVCSPDYFETLKDQTK